MNGGPATNSVQTYQTHWPFYVCEMYVPKVINKIIAIKYEKRMKQSFGRLSLYDMHRNEDQTFALMLGQDLRGETKPNRICRSYKML